MITEKTITDFLENEYLNYAKNILEDRAISSIVDSFKSVQRKAIFVSNKFVKNKYDTVESLSATLVSNAEYHHASSSAGGAIVNMAQDFKNNLPLFYREGQFGNKYTQIASSDRYIKVKLIKHFDYIFKDEYLLKYKVSEGKSIEPEFYLPIIPLILCNGSNNNIGIGHSTLILNRNVKDIINECILYLKNSKHNILNIPPYIHEFNGTITNANIKKWYIKGKYIIDTKKNNIIVKELPPSMTYSKFEDILDVLVDNRKIVSYDNKCNKDVNYVIKLNKEIFSSLDDSDIINMFELQDIVTENYTCLDENFKIKIFDTSADVLKYFVDFRLGFYSKRKSYLLNKVKVDINITENKARFIQLIIEDKLNIRNIKKNVLENELLIQKFDKVNNSYDYLLTMSINNLTKEKYDSLLKDVKNLKSEEKAILKTNDKDEYIKDLNELLNIL